jgi:hypothetical protein
MFRESPYRTVYGPHVDDRPLHQALYDWWNARRGNGMAPLRRLLDPIELRAHLGSLALIECLDGLADFRFRLVGTGIVDAFGRDSTGKTVVGQYAADPILRDTLLDIYRNVAKDAVTARTYGDLRTVDRQHRQVDSYHLPLARDDGSIGWILNQILFD